MSGKGFAVRVCFFRTAALALLPEMSEESERERRARFGYWLEGRRGGRTAAEVAGVVGRSRFWYLRLEEGQRRIVGLRDLRLLARGLGVEEGEMMEQAERAGY